MRLVRHTLNNTPRTRTPCTRAQHPVPEYNSIQGVAVQGSPEPYLVLVQDETSGHDQCALSKGSIPP